MAKDLNLSSQARLRALLSGIMTPDGKTTLAAWVGNEHFALAGSKLVLSIPADSGAVEAWEKVRSQAERALSGAPGISQAMVVLTAERSADIGNSVPGRQNLPALAGIRHIVAIASGKGGVGKSTTTCNLALALMRQGFRVGVLDADIYGPSQPKLFALKGQPSVKEGRILNPLEGYGCKVMSIGLVVDPEKAMVWRGPMVASALTQMLRDIDWGELDVMLVDMPPGTGDAQLTLSQQARLSGAVIVSTPQDLALIDARRGVAMFREVGVPLLGLIENMSYFLCDECGKRHDLFGHGGARQEAERLGIPFLGDVPLDRELRVRSDEGLPIMIADPESAPARAYQEMAARLAKALHLRPASA